MQIKAPQQILLQNVMNVEKQKTESVVVENQQKKSSSELPSDKVELQSLKEGSVSRGLPDCSFPLFGPCKPPSQIVHPPKPVPQPPKPPTATPKPPKPPVSTNPKPPYQPPGCNPNHVQCIQP
jgi:hypothetical protein